MRWLQFSIARFALVGLSNAAVGLLVIYIALRFCGWGDVASNVVGYTVGTIWSFAWNRLWVFRHDQAALHSFVRYLGVFALAYMANLAVLKLSARGFEVHSFAPQLIAVPVFSMITYLGCRFFAFPLASNQGT